MLQYTCRVPFSRRRNVPIRPMIGGVVSVTTASKPGQRKRLEHGPGVEAEVVGHPGQGALSGPATWPARGGCERRRALRRPAAGARPARTALGAEHVALVTPAAASDSARSVRCCAVEA